MNKNCRKLNSWESRKFTRNNQELLSEFKANELL